MIYINIYIVLWNAMVFRRWVTRYDHTGHCTHHADNLSDIFFAPPSLPCYYQSGDAIPADCILLDDGVVYSNESALTGEAEDLPKSRDRDCFLLSSCLLTEAEDKVRAVVIGKWSLP